MAFHRITDPDRLHELIDAILEIDSDAKLNDLLGTIVREAAQLVNARYGALGVVSSDGTTLTRFITQGVDDETAALIGEDPHGRGLLGEIIRRGLSLRVEDIAEDPRSAGLPPGHPAMTTFLGVPVRTANGRVFGNLYLTDRLDGQPFSEEDQLLVESFGMAAGHIIDQATLRDHVRELTLSEERERLARDLHDTVIQRLFGVGLSLQLALPHVSDDGVRERINSAIDDLDGTIQEIRTTIFEIDQDQIDGATLVERIRSLVEECATRLNIEVDLRISPDLNREIGRVATRHTIQTLREILSNIVRHSQATFVRVEVGMFEDTISLTVTDNGVGFHAPIGPGRGLRNLTSRARELGGDCVIESEPGRGTLVRWSARCVE